MTQTILANTMTLKLQNICLIIIIIIINNYYYIVYNNNNNIMI